MTREVYRYTFATDVPFEDVEASLLLALWGGESLHGKAAMRLADCCRIDNAGRLCTIDAGGPFGQDVNRLFLGFLQREFGPESFRVERVGERGVQEGPSATVPQENVSA